MTLSQVRNIMQQAKEELYSSPEDATEFLCDRASETGMFYEYNLDPEGRLVDVSQLKQDLALPPVHVCERPRAPSQRRSPTIFPLAIGQPLRCLKRQSPYCALGRRVRTSVCVGALMYVRGHGNVRM